VINTKSYKTSLNTILKKIRT